MSKYISTCYNHQVTWANWQTLTLNIYTFISHDHSQIKIILHNLTFVIPISWSLILVGCFLEGGAGVPMFYTVTLLTAFPPKHLENSSAQWASSFFLSFFFSFSFFSSFFWIIYVSYATHLWSNIVHQIALYLKRDILFGHLIQLGQQMCCFKLIFCLMVNLQYA